MKIIIIGGGVSGIVCAIHAKNDHNEVIVLERNQEPCKKLLMTGNGRCNYYNENQSLDNYHSKNHEILEQMYTLDRINLVSSFFEKLGIIPRIKNGYYYPYSNQALTVKNALLDEAKRKKIKIITNALVTNIEKDHDKFIVNYNNSKMIGDKVVVSKGSNSYPKTGSDGMGYSLLKKYHRIIKPLPALVALKTDNNLIKSIAGVRCEVCLELFENGIFLDKEEGELQITKEGISGICTFNLSHYVSRGLEDGNKEVIKINFIPFIKTMITPWLEEYSKIHNNKKIVSLLGGFLNEKIVHIVCHQANIDKDKYYKDLSKEEKIKLVNSLTHFKVEITSTKDFDSSQVTSGGVALDEVNPNSLESLKVKGLYVIGELLDIDGVCGGYNLTNAVLTGILSGGDIYND